MRITLTGPSGTGKTTLANFITETFPELTFQSNSAYNVLKEEQKQALKEKYGYEGTGHRNVIKLSHQNPDFGHDFQQALLDNRIEAFSQQDFIITDRCFVDNVAYYLDQCSAHSTFEQTQEFITKASRACQEYLGLVIWVPVQNPRGQVENNGSRVDNWYYQKKMHMVFQCAIDEIAAVGLPNLRSPKLMGLSSWDLLTRKQEIYKGIMECYPTLKPTIAYEEIK